MSTWRWIFGYGSLVWRPAFEHAERRAAWIEGFRRRFHQGSTDHRGVPGAPGRVVTLEPHAGERCWGMAYAVTQEAYARVMGALDVREQGGYARHEVVLNFEGGESARRRAVVYVATRDNPNYLGPAPVAEMAAQVVRAHGPSGPNTEYVLRLHEALRQMGAEDAHVASLADHVRALMGGGR